MKSIFIGGSGRSGTTLVQKILIIHSKIVGTDEFNHLNLLLNAYNKMNEPQYVNVRQKNFYTETQLKNYWKEFIEELFSTVYNSKEGAEFFTEKSPDNIYVAQTLLDLFPDSKFVFVYRDGRDVVNSFKQVELRYKQNNKSSGTKYPLYYRSLSWLNCFNIYSELKKNPVNKDRIFALRYEELVTKPKEVLSRLMDFIGLELEVEQLDPSAFGIKDLTLNIEKFWYDEKMFTQKINTGNINKWRKELNFFEKILVNIILSKRLRDEGYEINSIYLKLNWLFFKLLKISKLKTYDWKYD